jgi:hypothetical protein
MRYIVVLVFIWSCEGMLDLQPTNTISAENAIQNETDLQNAIRGCYDALQADGYFGRLHLVVGDLAADNAYNGGTILDYDQFNRNQVDSDNQFLEELWVAPFIAINRCNTVIYYTNSLELDDEAKEAYLAELYFIRSLSYYNLLRLFESTPLKLEPTLDNSNHHVPLSERSLVYEQIIGDLKFASNKLKQEDPYFATDLAVKTLLAKISLDTRKYEDAIEYADFVLTQDKRLLDNYEDLFIKEGNDESIFELSFTETVSDKNRLAEYCWPTNLGGRYEIAPEINFLNSFENGDVRKELFLGQVPYCNKYESIASGADNVYIFRLAELYLVRAEARTQLRGNTTLIMNDLNKIRARAGLSDIYSTSYNELMEFILIERRHEFAFEGHRRFDLVRTNRASDVLNIKEDQYYFPIPLNEITTNNQIN